MDNPEKRTCCTHDKDRAPCKRYPQKLHAFGYGFSCKSVSSLNNTGADTTAALTSACKEAG